MGNAHSENGWPYVDQAGCRWGVVPGTGVNGFEAVNLQIQIDAYVPMMAFAADIHEFVEKLRDDDSCCYTEGNSVSTSNHPSGSAYDTNWKSHPFHARGTFSPEQEREIQALLKFWEGIIFWAGIDWWKGGWGSPIDEMHWQMDYGTWQFNKALGIDRLSPHVTEWVKTHIRPDGKSTYRRGAMPATPPAVNVLTAATSLSLEDATAMLPWLTAGLKAAQCNNFRRIAMFIAQTRQESDNYNTTREYASGAEYEGRLDLGNTQPGDGVRFAGRSYIQITGRHNYTDFSRWAFNQGLVPTPTYFVDDPAQLEDPKWAFVGAAWYWTVQRPKINALCDANDIVGVTRAINGGENGLNTRRQYYTQACAQGENLLALLQDSGEDEDMAQVSQEAFNKLAAQVDRIFTEMVQTHESLSGYRDPGEGKIGTWCTITRNGDKMTHEEYTENAAIELGDFDSIRRIIRSAQGNGADQSPAFIRRARASLAKLEKLNEPALLAFTAAYSKGATS